MRRLIREEGGTVAALVVLTLVVLLGMAALVVDIGDGAWERRLLQNSADAAALAVAADCVQGDCQDEMATANAFATSNNRRGAYVVSVQGPDGISPPDPSDGELTVVTRTGTSAAEGRLPQFFSGILGQEEGLQGQASATVAWGATVAGRAIPLTISQCEFNARTGGNPPPPPVNDQWFFFASPSAKSGSVDVCPDEANPAGQDYPGGFGWLDVITASADEDAGQCIARINELGMMSGNTGNTAPKPEGTTGCSASFFQALVDNGTVVLLPVYDDNITIKPGNNAEYTIVGFTGLVITGFKLGGPPEWRYSTEGLGFDCQDSGEDFAKPATNCIRGNIVGYFDAGSVPTPGGTDFGAITYGLIR